MAGSADQFETPPAAGLIRALTMLRPTRLLNPRQAVRLVEQAVTAAEQALSLVPRMASVVEQVELIVADVRRIVGEIDATQRRARGVVQRADEVALRAEAIVRGAELLTARAVPLLDRYEPILLQLQPVLERLAGTTSPDEVTALVKLVDTLPEVLDSVLRDVLPMLGTLGTVAPDVRDLLDVSKELNEMLGSLPGLGRVKRRVEEQREESQAESPTTATARL
ncbi:MAG: hypothetical protein JWN95_2725 [Frankiales bacterium]|nr:hypothetical protein [Frankiales bacterium]